MRDSHARQLQPRPVQDDTARRADRIRRDYNQSRAAQDIAPAKKAKRRKKHATYTRVMKGSKSMPDVYKRDNSNIWFVVENERGHYRLPRNVLVSLVVIFVCAIGVILTNAQLAGVERQITQSRNRLNAIVEYNRTIEAQIGGHFTLEEIEYIAIMHLGMTPPDASQIIEINVPAQSHVEFNRNADLLPRENYFWLDIRSFASGVMDRIFGG